MLTSFELTEADPLDSAGVLIQQSLTAIFEDGNDGDLECEGSVRMRSQLIDQSSRPELVIAAVCDAAREWCHRLSVPILSLPDLEIVSQVANNEEVLTRLKIAADALQTSVTNIMRSVDPMTERIRFLPSLVAVPYAHSRMVGSFHGRFTALLMASEAAIRYLAVIALGPLDGDDTQARIEQLVSIGRRPTLGAYVQVVRERMMTLRKALPHTVAALQDSTGRWTPLGHFFVQEMTEIRNRLGPHGGVMADAAYVDPAQALGEKLDQLLIPLARDGHSSVLVVQQSVEVGKDVSYKYGLIELRGDSIGLPVAPHSSDQKLENRKVYLLRERDFIDLHPLVVYEVCPRCNFDEAFFLDHFDPRAPEWFSFRAGHRIP